MKLYKATAMLILCAFAISASAGNNKKIYVADHTDTCVGKGGYSYLQIKEKKKGAWKGLATTINGFKYEEGYEYYLSVTKSADGYALKKVISKTKTNYDPTQKLNRKWFLYSMHDDTVFINLMDSALLHMQFNLKEKTVSVKAVCNTMNGPITLSGNQLAFGDMASTKMYCEGIAIESIITAMLPEMKQYEVSGNALTLYSADRIRRMVWKWYK